LSTDNSISAETEGVQSVSSLLMEKADPLGISDFCVPYSVNKKGRWLFMDQAKMGIATFQDDEFGVRVSVIRSKIAQSNKENENAPETYVDRTPSNQVITDLHSFEDGNTIHKEGKRMNYASVSRKANPPRRRRGRLIRPIVSLPTEAIPDDHQESSMKKEVHIIYKEQCLEMSKREINTNKKMKREKNVRISLHRQSKRFPSDDEADAYDAVCDEFRHSESQWLQSDNLRCYADINVPLVQSLHDFVIRKNRSRNRSKKRKSGEVDLDMANDKHYLLVTESSDLPSNRIMALPAVTFPLVSYNSLRSFIDNEFTNAHKVDRLYPSTYAIHAVSGDTCEPLKSVLPEGFVGTVFIQDAGRLQGTTLLRCILNSFVLEEGLFGGGHNKERSYDGYWALNTKFHSMVLSPVGHLPKEMFANAQVYTHTEAAYLALSQRGSEWTCCDGDAQISTETGICRACYNEEDSCVSLSCKHYFCRTCWAHYVIRCLQNTKIPVTCPEYKCECVLELDHAMTILPSIECINYVKMMLDTILAAPENFLCVQCSSFIHVVENCSQMRAICCECGAVMCSHCKQSFHAPLNCAAAKHYSTIRAQNGHIYSSLVNDVTIMVKQCPSCKAFCQRWAGCDHMSCICGIEFCYRCLGLWNNNDHNGCKEQQLEKVLHDEPQTFIGNFSLRVFRRCQKVRLCKNRDNLRMVRGMLKHIPVSMAERKRMLKCYAELCQLLEILIVFHYYKRRRMGRLESVYAVTRLPHAESALEFLKTSIEVESTNRLDAKAKSRFLALIAKAENTLTSCMLQCCSL
uniref:RBR-type E3 ubiquitin transferase n=1 Tax=Toxocara canis TaxID=6265 RepID=A0A183VBW2_TOXCA